MSVWIIKIAGTLPQHWTYAKRDGVWDMPRRPAIHEGDALYFSLTGVPRVPPPGRANGKVGRIIGRATAASEPFSCRGLDMPWDDDHDRYTSRIELTDLQDAPDLGVDYSALKASGWGTQQTILRVRDQEGAAWLVDAFGPGNAAPQATPGSPFRADYMWAGSGATDAPIISVRRREQASIREALLLGSETAKCELCGRELPVSLLVAGHIKPRSMCSEDERRDGRTVAMLFCTLGCDRLFELGFVWVDPSGTIRRGERDATAALEPVIQALVDQPAPGFNADRAPHFAARRAGSLSAR